MTQKAIDFVETQIKEYTFLGEDARFVTIPQYPPFCWTELIVNAVAHRDYSILGTDIMVKIFDHHYIVESPGILPGMVRIDNIRQMHFSRNPKIVQYMQQYKLVKEFGEGVDRMFREMEQAGNPAPEYKQIEFMVKVRLNSNVTEQCSQTSSQRGSQTSSQRGSQRSSQRDSRTTSGRILNLLKQNPLITRERISVEIGISDRMVAKYLKDFQEKGVLERVGGKFGGQWVINDDETVNVQGGPERWEKSGSKTEPKEVENVGSLSEVDNKNVGSLSEECRKSDGSLAKMQLTDRQDLILKMIKNNPYVSAKAMSEVLSVTRRTVERDIALLQKNGIIRHRGNTSGGHWEVLK